MKKILFIKQGEYRSSLISEFSEYANAVDKQDLPQVINFTKRSDYSFQLVQNFSPAGCLAAAAFDYKDGDDKIPSSYRELEIGFILGQLDSFEYVILGSPTSAVAISEEEALVGLGYYSRDASGNIVNLKTGKKHEGDTALNLVTFAVVFKAGPLPVYYLISDPAVLNHGQVPDFECVDLDLSVRSVREADGTLKEHLFNTVVSPGSTLIGKYHLFAGTDEVELSFFQEAWCSKLLDADTLAELPEHTVSGTCEYRISGNKVILTPTRRVSTFRIDFKLGKFFSQASHKENPYLEYLVYRI